MSKRTFLLLVALTFGHLAFSATSSTADATARQFVEENRIEAPASGDLATGQWYHGLSRVRAYAEAKGIPLVAVWSNSGCGYCETLEKSFMTATFKKQMASSGYLYCFTWSKDADGAVLDDTWEWCTKDRTNTGYPLVRLYWKKTDGTKGADKAVKGDTVDGGSVDGAATYKYIANVFKDYVPYVPPAYECGSFVNGGTPGDRLELREDTTWLDIPLKREGEQVAWATNETLCLQFPGAAAFSTNFTWAANESNKTLRVRDLRPAGFTFAVGKTIAMTLKSGDAVSPAVSITLVDEPENSPKNPLWLGARTADTLAAGEWTMDLEIAKARAQKRGAPILALVGGSLWCPDCVKVDHYLVDTKKFGDWLSANDVTCVAIDVPNIASGKTTSLLTHDPYSTSDRYVTATDPEQDRVQSGAGYLSRNAIELADAAAVAARNRALVTTAVTEGGLCRPENMAGDNSETGPFKTGIPCLVMLRPDGSIVGRIFQFNNVSPSDTTTVDAYLSRMDELLAAAGDTDEEYDADWRTATEAVGFEGETFEASISAVDLADVRLLKPFEFAAKGKITLKALTAKPTSKTANYKTMATENNVQLSLLKVKDGTAVTAAMKKGNVFTGLSLDVSCVPEPGAKWYVEVRAIGTVDASDAERQISKTFALERKDDSTVAYALGLNLKYEASTLGFEKATVSVSEKTAGTFAVRIVRGDSVSGPASVKVVFDSAKTTAPVGTYGYELDGDADFAEKMIEWADGESTAYELTVTIPDDSVWDGDRTLAFRLEDADGSPLKPYLGNEALVITVKEDDKMAVGRLSFVDTQAFVVEGSTYTVGVERVNGASGAYGATLAATAGALASDHLEWANNDRQALKQTTLMLPTLDAAPKGGLVTVTLKPDVGISAVSSKKTLSIQLVESDCARFAVENLQLADLFRYVAVSNEIGIVNTHGGTLSVTKVSGALPAGLKVGVLSGASPRMVISGVPTAVKECVAVYQIQEKIAGTKHSGLTVKISFAVTDASKTGGEGGGALNPTVAKSRTFSDQMIADPDRRILSGLLTATLPPTGKASAKYRGASGTISLSAWSWSACSRATGVMTVTLTAAKTAHRLVLAAHPDGNVDYELDDPVLGTRAVGTFASAAWSRTSPATAFQGYYTVDCQPLKVLEGEEGVAPTGDGWLMLTLSSSAVNTGKMTYSGCLPNGKTFSGSAMLFGCTDGDELRSALLPVYVYSTTDFFTAVPEIAVGAADLYRDDVHDHRTVTSCAEAAPYWLHTAKETDSASFAVAYELYGAYYDQSEDVQACAEREAHYGKTPLFFSADMAVDYLPITVSKTSIAIAKGAANPSSVKLSFNRKTGLVNGTFKFVPDGASKSVTATYKGVLLPGWGGCSSCSAPGTILRPLCVGSFWYSDTLGYEVESKGKMVSKTLKIVRGGAFAVDEKKDE